MPFFHALYCPSACTFVTCLLKINQNKHRHTVEEHTNVAQEFYYKTDCFPVAQPNSVTALKETEALTTISSLDSTFSHPTLADSQERE